MFELLGKMRELLTQQERASPTHHSLSLSLSACQQLAKDIDSLGWAKSVDIQYLTNIVYINFIFFAE